MNKDISNMRIIFDKMIMEEYNKKRIEYKDTYDPYLEGYCDGLDVAHQYFEMILKELI